MAFSALTGKQALSARSIHVVGRDLLAGLVCGVLSLAFGLSFAALIFSGPLAPWLAYGIAASFIASSVAALVVALGSTLPFSIAGPDSSTSAVTAALVASVTQHLAAAGASDRLLVAALIVMPMSSALTGLLLCGLGAARGGRAIRFVPYPVIGGFLGATGVLVVSGACHVVIDHPLTFAESAAFLVPANATKLAAAAAVGMLLLLSLRRIRNAAVMPAVLLVCASARLCRDGGNRYLAGPCTSQRMDVQYLGQECARSAVAQRRARAFPVAAIAGASRRFDRRDVRHRDQHASQHYRH